MKNTILCILGGLMLCSLVYAQGIDTAIEELEKRGLLIRTIEKYRKDPGQYAYLKDLILVAYDLARKGTMSSDISAKIIKLESEVAKLKGSKTTSVGVVDEEKIKDLVRTKVSELIRISDDKIDKFENILKTDSLRISQLEKRVRELEQKSFDVASESPRWGILGAMVFASIVALLSVH